MGNSSGSGTEVSVAGTGLGCAEAVAVGGSGCTVLVGSGAWALPAGVPAAVGKESAPLVAGALVAGALVLAACGVALGRAATGLHASAGANNPVKATSRGLGNNGDMGSSLLTFTRRALSYAK